MATWTTPHNKVHAADVVQGTHFILSRPEVHPHMSNLEYYGPLLAAAVHDFEHPGLNNLFHVNAEWELAIRYNDKAVLENHHVAAAFKIATEGECDPFAELDRDEKKEIRSQMIDMVLATDMTTHFEHLGQFKSQVQEMLSQSLDSPR